MRISVVVCTFNPDELLLKRVLNAASAQLAAGSEGEMIVVDNNSDPPLDADALGSAYDVRVIRERKPGLTAAREAAIADAAGDIILFVDDDNLLGDGYLAAVKEEFAGDKRIGMFGASVVPEYEEDRAAWLGELRSMLAVRPYAPDWRVETTAPPYNEHFPIGAGIAVRRELAEAYVEDCAATSRIEGRRGAALSSGEDLDMGLFVLSRDYKLVVTGKATLTHVIANSRLAPEYITRLAIANVTSALELEAKWAPRFAAPIFPMLHQPLAVTLMRLVIASALGVFSRRMRVKRTILRALALRRFHGVASRRI